MQTGYTAAAMSPPSSSPNFWRMTIWDSVNTNLCIRNNYIIFGVKYRSQKPDIGNADREYI